MNTFAQALCSYTRQRWAMAILIAVVVAASLIASFVLDRKALDGTAFLLTNLIGMPVMASSFWVCTTAKWQFVNPRARLLPRFATPHLAVNLALLLAALVLWPAIVAMQTAASVTGCVAYAMLLAGGVLWGMHTFRQSLMLATMATMFAPAAPQLLPFWTGPDAQLPPWEMLRLATLCVGGIAVAAWLWRLTAMTEEHDDYLIPAIGATGSSRMEKSEFRRNIARQLSRGKLGGWFTDIWHNRIPRLPVATLPQRKKLLRYGFLNLPPIVTGIFFTLPVFVVLVAAYAWLAQRGIGGDPEHLGQMVLFQALIFGLMPSIILCQALAGRQPRLQQELMLPLTRPQFVGGLFQQMGRELVLQWILIVCLVLAVAANYVPHAITYTRVVIMPVAIAVGISLCFGLLSRFALTKSAVVKILIMLGGMYAGMLAGGGVFAVAEFLGIGLGLAAGAAMLAVSAWTVRWAYRYWLTAELGL